MSGPAADTDGEPEAKQDSEVIGITIALKPRLLEDDKIFMDIDMKYSEVIGIEEVLYEDKYPYQILTMDKFEITETTTVPNGGIVVLGKYIKSPDREEPKQMLILIKATKVEVLGRR
ncbi:MAG: hypothetical protein ACYS5F_10440 [Planctomycetota bacterium]|jgi:type II secretory pathway component GspD/PulD (secretin)